MEIILKEPINDMEIILVKKINNIYETWITIDDDWRTDQVYIYLGYNSSIHGVISGLPSQNQFGSLNLEDFSWVLHDYPLPIINIEYDDVYVIYDGPYTPELKTWAKKAQMLAVEDSTQ